MLCNEVNKLQIRSNKIVKAFFIAEKEVDLILVVQHGISILIFVQARYVHSHTSGNGHREKSSKSGKNY